jgi:type II secretion system protein G
MRVEADFNAIGSSIKTYQLNTGQLPPAELGLQALVTRPKSLPEGARWAKIMDRIPTDPWNRPYHYLAGDSFPDGFGIYSCGKDGVSASYGNDRDDRNTWTDPGADPPGNPVVMQIKIILLGAALTGLSFYLGRVSARRGDPEDLLSQG